MLVADMSQTINTVVAVAGLLLAVYVARDHFTSGLSGLIVVGLLSSIVGYAALSYFAPDPWGRAHRSDSDTSVVITHPIGTERAIPSSLIIEGKVTDLHPGRVLWAANKASNESEYYIANAPCTVEDDFETFSCPEMRIGLEGDLRTFEIVVWIVDGEAQRVLLNGIIKGVNEKYPPYLVNVPRGATVGVSVLKTRR